MSESYSPLRYPGGKAKLADFIIELMAKNEIVEPNYVEPYAGGAGAALRLLFEEYVDHIVINDADSRIKSFWEAVVHDNHAFIELLKSIEVSVEEWHRQREVYENADRRDVLEVGFATFFLNRTTRSGIIHNGGPIGGYDQTGNYKIDARFNREQLVRRVQRLGIYSDRIIVTGRDGLETLKEIEKNRNIFDRNIVYIDPPYYKKGSSLYLNKMKHKEHVALSEYLHQNSDFNWFMTYDNVKEIRDLYKDFQIFEFSLSYSAYERRNGEEILILPPTLTAIDGLKDMVSLIN